MESKSGNNPVSVVSFVASVLGALCLVSVVLGAWNYSVAGDVFMAGGALGLIGAICGFIARRYGRNSLNATGLWLGLAVVVATVALSSFYYIPDDGMVVTEIEG